jgi:hypothetical protein
MADDLFDRLKTILDDGLILTPDIEAAVKSLFADSDRVESLMANDAVQAMLAASPAYYAMIHAQLSFYEQMKKITAVQRIGLSVCGGVQLGIMLGLLAADRIGERVAN